MQIQRQGGGDLNSKISQNSTAHQNDTNLNNNNETNSLNSTIYDTYTLLNYNDLGEDEKAEGYVFHILSDFISDENRAKLQKLQNEFNKHYPCEIQIHIINNEKYKDCARVGAATHSFATYYKMSLGSVLDKNIKRCLYLDVDMLVLKDLREVFTIDLKDKALGASLDWGEKMNICFKAKDNNKQDKIINLSQIYINTGMMLVDLNLWRKYKIEEKCLLILKDYIPTYAEQCTINGVAKDYILHLPFKFNFLNSVNPQIHHQKGSCRIFPYTEEYLYDALNDIFIIHLLYPKPWNNLYLGLNNDDFRLIKPDTHTINYRREWWDTALNTPFFDKELLCLNLNITRNEFEDYTNNLANKILFHFNNLKQNYENKLLKYIDPKLESAFVRVKKQLSYKFGSTIISYSKDFKANLALPFALFKVYLAHKKEMRIYKEHVFYNPNLKLPPLESYADIDEALKIKEHLSYKLGQAFLKGLKTWYKFGLVKFYFEAKRLERDFGENKRKN